MTTHYPDPLTRVLVTISALLAVFMVTLDSTIAIIALPHIQSSTSASQEQIAWVLTSYLIASAIATPLAGWLAERFGRKRVMLISTVGFTLASIGCGLSTNLDMLVLFRLIQGAAGAGLVPLNQAMLLDITPPERHGPALAVAGLGTLVGPLIGPALGGWLTEYYSWRWVFLINVPFGLLGIAGMMIFMTERHGRDVARFDVRGFAALALFLGALQLMLDRGQQLDWFASPEIRIEAALTALGAWLFLVHSLTTARPFIKPGVFMDRNFLLGSLLATLLGVFIVGVVPIMTNQMQVLMGYPVLLTGWLSMPRALGNIITMTLVGRVITRADIRLLIFTGMVMHVGCLWFLTTMSLQSSQSLFALVALVQGTGSGLVFVPLSLVVFSTLRPELRNEGATLFALTRNLGASAGISSLQAMIIRETSQAHSRLVETLRLDNPVLTWRLPGFDPGWLPSALGMEGEVLRQASMLAYLDAYRLLLVLAVVMSPLCLFMRRPAPSPPRGEGAAPLVLAEA